MTDCAFCGLPSLSLSAVYGESVCADCVELAEIAFDDSEAM